MNIIKYFLQIILFAVFLSSCSTSTNKDVPIKNLEENINKTTNSEKKRLEIKFSCGEDGISEYLDDGWKILKEDSQEKVCTWKSVPATKDCDMEKDKGCKITKPDRIVMINVLCRLRYGKFFFINYDLGNYFYCKSLFFI